ncbi:MAG: 1-deoxy-D-xylulose-5-phosphate reductoisomerase [Coxiellaceae bacterium]|nr:MAG: 1-deoxy-D-xylulose-5-phosphate reductoisomerase [Coxiellaceae bacterium]
MQHVTILGSTGSIGQNTLAVIAEHPDRYQVVALSAQRNVAKMVSQCLQYQPNYAVMLEPDAAEQLALELKQNGSHTKVLTGAKGLETIASLPEVDTVMAAIVGAAGLMPTLAAVRGGKRILLANKEALVMAGALFMAEVKRYGATLLPIDSEHNALFQCMPTTFKPGLAPVSLKRIILTASGGPFRELALTAMRDVTPDQACAHPNWVMGRKISVDSATMMNKALEVIEAHWLFGVSPSQIDVIIHPQSIIHSLVEYEDGSMLAQLGNPDMRIPISYALAWPERIAIGVKPLNLLDVQQLQFYPLNKERYPALELAYEALAMGGTATAILNAANEVSVAAFLDGQISFTQIAEINAQVLKDAPIETADTLDQVIAADTIAREMAAEMLVTINF